MSAATTRSCPAWRSQYTHAELKQLAAYFASLPGNVKTVAESRFRGGHQFQD